MSSLAGSLTSISFSPSVGKEVSLRINETAGAMFLVGILVMPLGLTALILAVRLPTRE